MASRMAFVSPELSKHPHICGYGRQKKLRIKDGERKDPCTILIPNWQGGEVIELCIESIITRTRGIPYTITVYDSTGEGSREREYLKTQRDAGYLKLMTSEGKKMHAEAVEFLLKSCRSEWACLLDNDIEVLHESWLTDLFKLISNGKDFGVAKYEPPYAAYDQNGVCRGWVLPCFRTFCMLLNMPLYKKIASKDWKDDWKAAYIPSDKNLFPEVWKDHLLPYHKKVFLGGGGGLTRTLLYFNEHKLRMYDTPPGFWEKKLKHYGHMSNPQVLKHGPHPVLKKMDIHDALMNLRRGTNFVLNNNRLVRDG